MKRIITLFLFLLSLPSFSQEALPINLEKVLELGGANNLTIKEYQQRQELATADVAKAKEWWLPELYGGIQAHQLWGAVMNGNGNFFLDVNRNNLWLGLGLNANWNFGEGIYATKAANYTLEASRYKTEAERNKALLESITAYYTLMTSQLNYTAYKNLVSQSDTIIQQIEVQVAAGLRYQSELLLAKSNKSHLQVEMLNAKKDYFTASAELVTYLNLDPRVKLVSVDSTLLPLSYTEELITEADSFYLNRPEFKANGLEIEALITQKKMTTAGLWIPELSVGAYGSYFGSLNGEVNPMAPISNPSTNQLYPTGAVNASLLWKIPLGSISYNGDNKRYSSLISLKQIESDRFKAEINEEISRARIEILTGKEQIEIAKEALDFTTQALTQSVERQQFGTAKPFEVFQAQQFYLQAQIDYLQAVSEFNKAQFSLKVAKGELL